MMKSTTQAVALWGNQAPAHSITAMMITDDQKTIVTGSLEGQICLWHLSMDMKVTSKAILFGHTAAITCLAKARDFEKQPYVVSGSENGEMCVWNVNTGHCIENAKQPYRHTAIYYYHCSFRMTGEGWLLCCGHYQDILIVDAKTLQVLYTFKSQCSDWICCMCIVHSTRIQEDSLVAISASGELKVWDLSSSVNSIREKLNVYETETKNLEVVNYCAVRFCTYTERLLLVICSSSWKVYDYCDFSLLCSEDCKSGQTFAGGEFLAANRLIIWTQDGHSYIYQLLNSGLSKSVCPGDGGLLKETITPHLLCSTMMTKEISSCTMGFMNERKEPFFKILYSGDSNGQLNFWHIPDVPVSQFDGSPLEIPLKVNVTLQEMFDKHKSMSQGIIDHLRTPSEGVAFATVTASLYIASLDKLVCGCEDGNIVITFALHAARARLLQDQPLLKGSLPHKIFAGHDSSVTSLLYPHGRSEKYDPSWLISGDQNSSIIWRDVFTGEIFHNFQLQSGAILKLLVPPNDYKVKLFQSIYCICSDNSVALLNLQERICFFHARKHLFPVKSLKWHPVEEVLVVGCEDGAVYVWEIESGTLERHETGEMAKAILTACEDFIIDDFMVTPTQETQRHSRTTFKSSNSHKLGALSHHLINPEKSSNKNMDCSYSSIPFTVVPVRSTYNISLHLLLFDLEKVLELLQCSQANGLKSANSFHSYDALKSAKSSSEKRPLTLKRNKTAGSLYQMDGPASESANKENFSRQLEESSGIKRHKKFKSTKKNKSQSSGKIDVNMVTDAAKLLLSCLLPWGIDKELDNFCIRHLDVLKLQGSVTFGVISGIDHLCLMLPGWNQIHHHMTGEQSHNLLSKKVIELSAKYSLAVQKQHSKKEQLESYITNAIGLETLLHFLKKLLYVSKSLRVDLISSCGSHSGRLHCILHCSQEKMESTRGKWKSTEHFNSSFAAFSDILHDKNGSSFPDPENVFIMKIVSTWKDQSIQVTEAMQAVLLAEIRKWMDAFRQSVVTTQPVSVVDSSCPQHPLNMEPSYNFEQLFQETSLQTLDASAKSEKAVNFQEPESITEKSGLEDTDSPDEIKQNPWMSKVCYCKVC
ncbi:WD repeat-containing protein 72 isoform X2 [Hyla sarda]|uniref:WD repeat-containing protein 72 isoform X2 n=1 Tax=Hyla sarda TaxID=327740 RepID=UPI0024C2D0EB|nr:WD repeat-containing protein 72 isoform X2 [Hyla sarda]XP_056428320.1 WD repeat-containing protein 72 isoform X2 [Hyla sarda]XP_056428321.1 WD repeat-containing protein 72 isoform X2 [Hyla sarda]